MKHQTDIQYLRFKLSILLIRTDQAKEILCCRKARLRIVNDKTLILIIMLIALIAICSDQRKLCNQFHTLTKDISNADVIRAVII